MTTINLVLPLTGNDAAALSALSASADKYDTDNLRIIFGPTSKVSRVLSDYADSEYQETYDVPQGHTFALIVFANAEQAADAQRRITTKIGVRVLVNASGNLTDDGV